MFWLERKKLTYYDTSILLCLKWSPFLELTLKTYSQIFFDKIMIFSSTLELENNWPEFW